MPNCCPAETLACSVCGDTPEGVGNEVEAMAHLGSDWMSVHSGHHGRPGLQRIVKVNNEIVAQAHLRLNLSSVQGGRRGCPGL